MSNENSQPCRHPVSHVADSFISLHFYFYFFISLHFCNALTCPKESGKKEVTVVVCLLGVCL